MNRRPEMVGQLAHFAGGTARRPRTLKVQRTSDCLLACTSIQSKLSLPKGKFASNEPASCSNNGVGKTAFPYSSMSLVRQTLTKTSLVPRRP